MDAPRWTAWVSKSVPIRRPDSSVRGLLGLVCGLDSTVLAAGIAVTAGSLSGLDPVEPLRQVVAVATGAAWTWLVSRG